MLKKYQNEKTSEDVVSKHNEIKIRKINYPLFILEYGEVLGDILLA
jgi:hypothetical protein